MAAKKKVARKSVKSALPISVEMLLKKETKNSWNFAEAEFPSGEYLMGSVYIQKRVLEKAPKSITVTVE